MTSLAPTSPQSVFDRRYVSIARLLIVEPTGETMLRCGECYDWDQLLIDFLLQSRNGDGETPMIIAVMHDTDNHGGYPLVHHYGVPSLDKGHQPGERLVSVKVLFRFGDGGNVLRSGESCHLPDAVKLTRVSLSIDTLIDGSGEAIRQTRVSDLVAGVVFHLDTFTLEVLSETT